MNHIVKSLGRDRDCFSDICQKFHQLTIEKIIAGIFGGLQFKNMGCNMSIKLHFHHSHSDKFSENLGDMRENQGGSMYQDLRVMEEFYYIMSLGYEHDV